MSKQASVMPSVLPLITPKLKDLTLPFSSEDIEWRVQRSGSAHGRPWALVLAYVDARAVQNRLDEVVGPENWTVKYNHIQGGVMCDLAIRCNDEWVTKSDGSPETAIEAFKGGISKALVRAASVWGIGRYLYRLTDGFARFVDKRVDGAREVKIDGQYYYWLPPELPEWALPAGGAKKAKPDNKPLPKVSSLIEDHEPSDSVQASMLAAAAPMTNGSAAPMTGGSAAALSGVSGPASAGLAAGDSLTDAAQVLAKYFKPEDDDFVGGYIVNFGKKHFGKHLADMEISEIEGYKAWLLEDSKKSGKPLSGKAADFIEAAEAYLNNFRAEQKDAADDLPF